MNSWKKDPTFPLDCSHDIIICVLLTPYQYFRGLRFEADTISGKSKALWWSSSSCRVMTKNIFILSESAETRAERENSVVTT